MTKTVKNMSFSKGACLKKKTAASLKRRNNGLGLPIHIKKVPILMNIRYYILNIRYYLYILPIYITYIKYKVAPPKRPGGAAKRVHSLRVDKY